MTKDSEYSSEQLANMSQDELREVGQQADEVEIIHRASRWPEGEVTAAEKRAERSVAAWFAIAGIAALAFLAVYLFWPWEYKGQNDEGYLWYTFYTPLLGITIGVAILALGIGTTIFTKKFIPQEVSVQQRHDGASAEVDQLSTAALLNDAWSTSTLGRRGLIKKSMIFGAATVGVAAILPAVGGLVKNPWKRGEMTVTGDGTLWTTGWTLASTQRHDGKPAEKVYLGRDTGAIVVGHDHSVGRLARLRPEDLPAGAMETVFPLPKKYVDAGYTEHMHIIHGARNPVMLIRLRPDDASRVTKRKGQEDFNYGDYYAYSKICTHLACPTSLYEAQTSRILCPCHQSQFDALTYGKPIFGPAARALPQLPITVDEDGYLVAADDFIEAVGPAFWERRS